MVSEMATGDNSPENNQSIKYFICPLCQGSGQLSELMQLPPIEISYKANNNINNSNNNGKNNSSNNNNNSKKSTLKSPDTIKLPLISSKLPTLQNSEMKIERTKKNKKEYLLKPQSAHSGGDFLCNDKADFIELLPPPFTLRNPAEAMKYSMMQLNSENWEIVMQGFGTVVQVSRTEPLLLEPHMTKVNQILCTLLRTTRSHVARYACQACKELFRTMQSTARPEFDEIVQSLLQRTADTNKFIRHDSNDALDTMVTYIPPNSSVRAIVEKGPFHKNSLIRTAVARLLLCIVTIIQVQFLFTLPAYKETRKRIFDAAAVLISDANMATRNIIKRLFEMFMKDNNFETLFQKETDKVLLKRIDKDIICLKYKQTK